MMTTTIDELNHLRATRMSRVANKLKSVSVSKVTALSDVEYNVYFLFVVIWKLLWQNNPIKLTLASPGVRRDRTMSSLGKKSYPSRALCMAV